MAQPDEATKRAGRGLIAIAGAKIFFILAGYTTQLLLPRLLGSPELFGLYSKVVSGISILNNVLIAATIQSVSKFVSEDESRAPFVLRQGLKLQLWIGGLLAIGILSLAPLFADFHHDPAALPLFRIAAVLVFAYALYAAIVGTLNGRQLFAKQAGLDMTFATLRTVGILGGAALLTQWGALGSVAGFAAAAVLITVLALSLVGLGSGGGAIPMRTWIAFMAPIWIYQGLLNGILQLDVQILSNTVSTMASEAGLEGSAVANEHVGFYRAAQTFAFVPYQLILAMTFIIFPMISKATSAGDDAAARSTIRGAMRLSLLLLLGVAAPIAGASDGVMRIAYPEAYLAGAPALGILVFGIVAFALFVLCATVLSSAGRPATAAWIALFGLLSATAGNYFFVREVGIGEHTLSAAAAGTALGMFVALLLAGGTVYLRFRTLFAPITVVRALVAGAVGFAVAGQIPSGSRIMALVALAGGFFAYAGTLLLLRELKRADLQAAFRVLKR